MPLSPVCPCANVNPFIPLPDTPRADGAWGKTQTEVEPRAGRHRRKRNGSGKMPSRAGKIPGLVEIYFAEIELVCGPTTPFCCLILKVRNFANVVGRQSEGGSVLLENSSFRPNSLTR